MAGQWVRSYPHRTASLQTGPVPGQRWEKDRWSEEPTSKSEGRFGPLAPPQTCRVLQPPCAEMLPGKEHPAPLHPVHRGSGARQPGSPSLVSPPSVTIPAPGGRLFNLSEPGLFFFMSNKSDSCLPQSLMAIKSASISEELGACRRTAGAREVLTIEQRAGSGGFPKAVKSPSYWQALHRTCYPFPKSIQGDRFNMQRQTTLLTFPATSHHS